MTESSVRDLTRQLMEVARQHIAYSQVANFMYHLNDHLSAIAYAEEVNQKTKETQETENMDKYYIWSNEHRAWWGPDRCGYSSGLLGAGVYTRGVAIMICRDAIPSAAHCGVIAEIPVRCKDVEEFLVNQLMPACIL